MNRFVIAVAVGAASAGASPAPAATAASTQFGFVGPRAADPVSVNGRFGAMGDPANGRGRADAASLGGRLEVAPFTAGFVDAAGEPIPAFIRSETRDYTVAAFAPDVAPIPLPAAAPLLLAGLAAPGLLRRARRD